MITKQSIIKRDSSF